MARILVVSDDDTYLAEVSTDVDGEGHASASWPCGWTTDPDRADSLHDVIEETSIHIDIQH